MRMESRQQQPCVTSLPRDGRAGSQRARADLARADLLRPHLAIGACGLVGLMLFGCVGGCSALQGKSTLFGSDDDPKVESLYSSDNDEESTLDKIGSTVKELVGKGPNPEYSREQYALAQKAYDEALAIRATDPEKAKTLFYEAGEKYKDAADRWPGSSLEHDALFRSGESYFFGDHYPKADDAYAMVIKKYDNSKYLDIIQSRRFRIAEYWNKSNEYQPHRFLAYNFFDDTRPGLDTGGNALRVWDRMRIDDPTGKLADDATMSVANSHFRGGRFLKADEYYTDIRTSFPNSEHQFDAHLLGLRAKIQSYQGPQYSPKALDEAEKLVMQIRKLFPREAEQEREYLERAFREIRFKKAEREWLMGQFYDRRAEYRAAQMYYDTLMQEFDDTPFASQAEARMREIQGKPPTPPQRLSWLVKLFPPREDVKPILKSDDLQVKRR